MLRDSKKLPDYLQEYRKNYTFAAELMIQPYGSTVKPGDMTIFVVAMRMELEGSQWGEISAFKIREDADNEVERCKRNDVNDGLNFKYEYRVSEVNLY